MPLSNHARNHFGTFGPTHNGKEYKPNPKHGIHAQNRYSKWVFTEGYEYDVFLKSDFEIFFCSVNRCYFGIVEKGALILGKEGERLSKFPMPPNELDAWHGYPVFSSKIQDRPSDAILDKWERDGIITHTTKRKIERGDL